MFFSEQRSAIAWWIWSNLSPGRTVSDAYSTAFIGDRSPREQAVARLHLRWMGRLLRVCRVIDPFFR